MLVTKAINGFLGVKLLIYQYLVVILWMTVKVKNYAYYAMVTLRYCDFSSLREFV